MKTKVCKQCGEEKPAGGFYKTGAHGKYRDSTCKLCRASNKKAKALPLSWSNPERYTRSRNGVTIKSIRRSTHYSVCSVLKEHHEKLSNDPDHLTTDFIQTLIGRKCI